MLELLKKTLTLKNGETMAYLDLGKGDQVILFIHGNMSSGLHYKPLLERLPEGVRAIVPDLRGFGDSSYHTPIQGLEDFADDLFDLVGQLAVKRFTLVGWSTGGGVCLSFEARHPGLAKNMVLIESVGHMGYPIFKKDEKGQAVMGQVYGTREEMGLDPVQVLPAVLAMQNHDLTYMKMLWDMAIYSVGKPDPEADALYLEETLKQRNLVDVDWALATFNMSHGFNGYTQGNGQIDQVELPVLSFWSAVDYVVPEAMVTSTVEAIGANAEYVRLEASGHSPLVDCPDLLAERIYAFMGR